MKNRNGFFMRGTKLRNASILSNKASPSGTCAPRVGTGDI